jgi:hypothetical protein
MTEYLRTILTGQYEASLAMLRECIRTCRPEHWEGLIAKATFRRIAYHALFFTDLYLSPREDAFELRDLHRRGGWTDPDGEAPRIGLSKEESLEYADACRTKVLEAMASETTASLEGPGGFWQAISRGELHLYNIRHIQHHAGQLSAYLRRVDPTLNRDALDWVDTGWVAAR